MRVAALYDIHGNLPALEAVLDEIRAENVDQIVVGGDVVPGPMTLESLEKLLSLEPPVRFIRGNCEVAVLSIMRGTEPAKLQEQVLATMRWTAQHLGTGYERLFAGWPRTLQLDVTGLGRVLFCHGTPRDEDEIFTRQTPEERLLPVFDGLGADVVVCGHTHMQFDRRVGRTRVVNAGSVGMAFGKPGACWLLLGPDVQLRTTSYDQAEAVERIMNTPYPDARNFATRYVQQPPSEEEMLKAFGPFELK